MVAPATLPAGPRLALQAALAADLMAPNPVSLRADATIQEALILLIDHAFSAAPVIDESGKPLGVLSRSDLLIHEREKIVHAASAPEFYQHANLNLPAGAPNPQKKAAVRVRDVMTPVVFSVAPDAPAATVI